MSAEVNVELCKFIHPDSAQELMEHLYDPSKIVSDVVNMKYTLYIPWRTLIQESVQLRAELLIKRIDTLDFEKLTGWKAYRVKKFSGSYEEFCVRTNYDDEWFSYRTSQLITVRLKYYSDLIIDLEDWGISCT